MIQNVLSGIGGIGLYGVISICLFFAVFLGVLVWAFSLKPSHLNAMRDLPLDDGERATSIQSEKPSRQEPSHE